MSTHEPARFLDRTTPPHIFTLILVTGLGALSMNIFLPSLPAMTDFFATDYRLMQLSVSLYLLVNAVLQILIGPISDRFGRRPVILGGTALFMLATIGCLAASTVEVFLFFRMMQAVIVTGLVLGRAVVRDMHEEAEAASKIGYVTMGMAVVPMIGPGIGGVLEQSMGWQANFWLLLLLGGAILALVWADLGETARTSTSSLPEQIAEYPELLTSRRFWGYCATAAFASGAFFSYLGGAPYVGSEVFNLSAAQVGFYFGAPAVGYFFGNGISGRYSTRVGINGMILWGTIVTAVGMTLSLIFMILGIQTPFVFFGFMTFVGFGNGMVLPNATSGMLSVRPHLAGTASGLGGAIMLLGGAAMSALAGAVLTEGTGAYPLVIIMLITSLLSVFSIVYTVRREQQVAQT
ncbi:multidrug effflux MFS transporter [Gymnodinialimonas ceratoperidinii]|uniref:Bcr/CflA family efflux transporter n=1 Tax=Gymnodinialimonas ceratoperidinii TaxID=2856823 RepID=A0A8F6YB95_9RHOB|nr:multidrug effflux MFS transporter [Gymnodinialimonas ceratoperidinii]QXT40749.1 multidrug effflux MFS transporter [Gymnodinialimonas ceratoperidinii]